MPLLRKKPFVPLDLPPDLKADEEVFLNVLTKEIFRDYEEYFRRSILCNSLVWSCEYTGKSNLTLPEALASESEAAEQLDKMPIPLQQGICFIIHKNKISSLTAFVDEVLTFYRTRFLIGERVEIASSGKAATKQEGTVVNIEVEQGSAYHHPNHILYTCTLTGSDNQITVTGNKLCRARAQLTRERVKLLAKCSAKKVSTDPPLYAVKAEHIERLKLADENFTIPYIGDYSKPSPKMNNKRKSRDTEGEGYAQPQQKKKKKLKKKLPNGDVEEPLEEPRITAEERRKMVEEERARRRKEKQEEKENQKKLQQAEQAFQREWMKIREDLQLTDSKELPLFPVVNTALPVSLFGDMLQVGEFFHLFGEHVDLTEDFPDGVQMGALEKSLMSSKQNTIFGDTVIFLLKLIFALQEEEDEEEEKFADRYNINYTPPTLNQAQLIMTPSVTWHSVVKEQSRGMPWAGAAQACYFTQYYLGTPLHNLQLDSYTVTEILRLHILGAGGRNSGHQYNPRWRFNHRGMYSDYDNPCVELRNRDPSLIGMLSMSNIFDLPPASKLTILVTLIGEILTYAQFREIIEEAIDGSRDAKKEWKSFGTECQRKEKEEAANRYREWIASRIKIKEEKKKKKSRLSEVAQDTDLDSDRSLQDTDISLAAEDGSCPTTPGTSTPEEREQLRLLNKTQEFHLYTIFREISCKLKVKPLGLDRYYRKYYSFHCAPGVFVEESSLDICTLFENRKPEYSSSSSSYQLTSASQLNRDIKANGIKEEDIVVDPPTVEKYFINDSDNLPVPATEPSDIITIIDPSTMTVEEIVQLKLREAKQKHGQAATTFSKLTATPGFGLLCEDQPAWCHVTSESLIRDLINCLNPRGEREKELSENLNKDLTRILHDLETKESLVRWSPGDDEEEEAPSAGEDTDEQRTARKILKKTSTEKLTEASLREQICDLENRIFEANFGAVKVKNRMAWRQEIEDFWLDDSVKSKVTEGDVPEIPPPIVHQRLMALRASQQSAALSEDDTSSLTSGSSTIVSRRSIIQKLSHALLSVANGIPAKYLTLPLGEEIPKKSLQQQPCIPCDIPQIQRWRESISACSSLSQILLHITALDSSIMWSKSILKTNCRICRRKCDPEKILLCDGCDCGQHLYCLKPKLKSIPTGKWFCNACKPAAKTKRTRAKLVEISSDEEEEEEEESEEELPRTRGKRKSTTPPKTTSEKLALCQKLINLMKKHEDGWPFLYPVDGDQIRDYYDIIPNPMDLSTVESKLKSKKYRRAEAFIEDVNQIFLNCQHYNTKKAPAFRAGTRLQKMFQEKLEEFGIN